jgi:hypothetical protein
VLRNGARRPDFLHRLSPITALPLVILFCLLGCQSHPSPPPIISASQWGSHPQPILASRKQIPVWITIHHAGELWTGKISPQDYLRHMQTWGQSEKHWPDLPYHFLIAPDGTIYQGRPVIYEPDSNTRYGLSGNIGIELFGNFELQRPSPQQLQSCVTLCSYLCNKYKIDVTHIRGHKDAATQQTVCPGKDFYRYLSDGQFRNWVSQTLTGHHPTIEPGPPLPNGPADPIPT